MQFRTATAERYQNLIQYNAKNYPMDSKIQQCGLYEARKEIIMKNQFIFACALLAVSVAALTGCGSISSSDTAAVDSTTTTSAAETTTIAETTTTAETTTIAEATTTAEETAENKETDAASESETTSEMTTYANGDVPSKPAAPSVAEAKAVMEALDEIDGIGATVYEYDESTKFTAENGYEYAKPTNCPYASTAEINAHLEKYLTSEYIAQRYTGLTSGDTALFVDKDGELYMLLGGRGSGYAFTGTDPVIVDSFADGYSIVADIDDFGSPDKLEIVVVKENGTWKVLDAFIQSERNG